MSELPELDEGFQELVQIAAQQTQRPTINVRFYTEAIRDEDAQKKTGKVKFRDVEMIEKSIPGDKDIIRHEATDEEKKEFAALYVAWRKGQNQDETLPGFPIRKWPQVTNSEAETLAYNGIKTVEQLAAVADVHLQRIGPYMKLRQDARDWLENEKKGATVVALRSENAELRGRLETLERMLKTQSDEIAAARSNGGTLPRDPSADAFAQLEAIKQQVAALTAAQTNGAPKRRGRPPKAKEPSP